MHGRGSAGQAALWFIGAASHASGVASRAMSAEISWSPARGRLAGGERSGATGPAPDDAVSYRKRPSVATETGGGCHEETRDPSHCRSDCERQCRSGERAIYWRGGWGYRGGYYRSGCCGGGAVAAGLIGGGLLGGLSTAAAIGPDYGYGYGYPAYGDGYSPRVYYGPRYYARVVYYAPRCYGGYRGYYGPRYFGPRAIYGGYY